MPLPRRIENNQAKKVVIIFEEISVSINKREGNRQKLPFSGVIVTKYDLGG
jgi:hypothetical protein